MNKINEKLKSDVKQIQIICDYLIKECDHDTNLTERVLLENKTVDEMYQYIMTAVKNRYKDQIVQGGLYVAPEDVYSLAIHYFIEEDETLKKEFPKEKSYKPVEKTTVQKQHENAVKKAKKEKEKSENEQLSLFDLGNDG